jgi:hypothetical protein
MQCHGFRNFSPQQMKMPDPLIGIGRKPKKNTFSAMRSFPTKPRESRPAKWEARTFPPKPSALKFWASPEWP